MYIYRYVGMYVCSKTGGSMIGGKDGRYLGGGVIPGTGASGILVGMWYLAFETSEYLPIKKSHGGKRN